jgi:hypothetical protein
LSPCPSNRGRFRQHKRSQKKALEVWNGTEKAYQFAKKYKIKTGFGTDILFDAHATNR